MNAGWDFNVLAMEQSKTLGRPRQYNTTMKQIAVRFPEEMLTAVDDIVRARLGSTDRASIIREALMNYIIDYKGQRNARI